METPIEGKTLWQVANESADGTIWPGLAVADKLVNRGEHETANFEGMFEEGIDPDFGTVALTLSLTEQEAVMVGLHLVGLFSVPLRVAADSVIRQLAELTYQSVEAYTDDEREAMNTAFANVMNKRAAALLGSLDGTALPSGIWTSEEPSQADEG